MWSFIVLRMEYTLENEKRPIPTVARWLKIVNPMEFISIVSNIMQRMELAENAKHKRDVVSADAMIRLYLAFENSLSASNTKNSAIATYVSIFALNITPVERRYSFDVKYTVKIPMIDQAMQITESANFTKTGISTHFLFINLGNASITK